MASGWSCTYPGDQTQSIWPRDVRRSQCSEAPSERHWPGMTTDWISQGHRGPQAALPTYLADEQDGQLSQVENLVSRAAHQETGEVADPSAPHDDHGGPTLFSLVEDLERDKGRQ